MRFQLSLAVILYLLTPLAVSAAKSNLYLSVLVVPRRPSPFVSKLSAVFHSWLRHKRPSTDTASLPTRVTTRYRPFMGHYYRFKRGDPVIILSGRYRGHQGVIDSAVFQRTVDFPGEFAPGSTVVAP